jgi:hypothetical protein
MTIPFIDRNPTPIEIERFRLVLSTYQDGSGMLKKGNATIPGWRDYERSVAAAFGGKAFENKWIYDVVLNSPGRDVQYGISCKMRSTLRDAERKGRVTIELSNASGEFWDAVKTLGITQEDFHSHPDIVGATLIEVVEGWHASVGIDNDGVIDNMRSFFLVLQWDKRNGRYQLFQYAIDLPEPNLLSWNVDGRRLIGHDGSGVLLEWYGLSGGQLKYYPLVQSASWQSDVFQLEPLPAHIEFGLQNKAAAYFPELWR